MARLSKDTIKALKEASKNDSLNFYEFEKTIDILHIGDIVKIGSSHQLEDCLGTITECLFSPKYGHIYKVRLFQSYIKDPSFKKDIYIEIGHMMLLRKTYRFKYN